MGEKFRVRENSMKKIGTLLIVSAIAMIAFYYVYQISIDKKIEQEVNNYIEETTIIDNEEIEEVVEVTEKKEEPKREINYTAILEIPSINLKRGVVDSTNNFKSLNYAISVDRHSKYPNSNGNFILYAHSGSSSIAYFRKLDKLEINDMINVYYNGVKYHYKIFNIYNIEKTGKTTVLNSTNQKYITLITCDQRYKNKQLVVVGEFIGEGEY